MNIELIKQILIVAMASSIISTAMIQKIKSVLKAKKWLFIVSIIVSGIIGIYFTLSFTTLGLNNSIWVSICTWVGAEAIYTAFEDKIFKSFTNINNIINLDDEKLNEKRVDDDE